MRASCRDEGILTGNDLVMLPQSPLTSSPVSPDIIPRLT